MKLSLHTDYALRVLLYLGANPGRRVTLGELADRYQVSLEHLRKVVHRLGTLGYINTFRGKQGGIELNRDPQAVNIGELVEATEPRQAVIDCQSQPCILVAACSLRGVLREAEDAFYGKLKAYSLADLMDHPRTASMLIASAN